MEFMITALLFLYKTAAVFASPFDFVYNTHLAQVGNYTYEYVQAEADPGTEYRATVLLVHGFPDLAYGWHYQIPLFTSLGYRVIAPNVLGYGHSSSPAELEPYLTNNLGNDIVELVRGILGPTEKQIILGGHDWGAAVVWDIVVNHPDLIKAVIGLAVPHGSPAKEYIDLADLIESGQSLNQGYMLQFRDPSFVGKIQGSDNIRGFLRGIFGGTTLDGEPILNATHGVKLDMLSQVQPAELLPAEFEDFYVEELVGGRDSIAGPLHAYRTSRQDWQKKKAFEKNGGSFFIDKPTLFICGLNDPFVPCAAADGMEMMFANIEMHELEVTHWIQVEAPQEVNMLIEKWLKKLEGNSSC